MMKDKFITPEGAIIEEEQLLELYESQNSHCKDSLIKLVIYYSRTKRPENAMACIKKLKLLTDDSEYIAKFLTFQGQIMEQQSDYETALYYYRAAVSFDTKQDVRTRYLINNNLGYCLNRLERYIEAEGYLQTAIEIDPSLSNAYKNLGLCFWGQKDYLKAANCLITATQVNSSDSRAQKHLEKLIQDQPDILEFFSVFRQETDGRCS